MNNSNYAILTHAHNNTTRISCVISFPLCRGTPVSIDMEVTSG